MAKSDLDQNLKLSMVWMQSGLWRSSKIRIRSGSRALCVGAARCRLLNHAGGEIKTVNLIKTSYQCMMVPETNLWGH